MCLARDLQHFPENIAPFCRLAQLRTVRKSNKIRNTVGTHVVNVIAFVIPVPEHFIKSFFFLLRSAQ